MNVEASGGATVTLDAAAASAGSDDPRVVECLEDYMAAVAEGRRPDRDALLARYPEIAGELAPCLDALALVSQVAPELDATVEPADALRTTALGTLGDFRLVRELGRGGMGVVYEAWQVSLQRRVALKVLPFAAVLDPRRLQRFKNESLAAASLDHSGIVRIYSVGCERGVHFYAMQFIEGRTLAQVIRELKQLPLDQSRPATLSAVTETSPTEARGSTVRKAGSGPPSQTPAGSIRGREFFRFAARLGIQAAEALEHAHQMGVVHRDVKPSNLMLDAQGRLWVTDFGLAMTQVAAELTVSGDILGTIRYMSPEQAAGRRQVLGQQTDIYSLGVTLYELLTCRPPFEDDDRQHLLRQIAETDPPLLRQVNRAIPRDLETIVLKAMAKEPQARYATAQDLADDLRRFAQDEPIRARRPSPAARLAKWARRHRTVVWSAVVVLLMAVVGLSGSTALVVQKEAQTAAALVALRDRDRELEAALASEKEARRIAEERRIEAEREQARADRTLSKIWSHSAETLDTAQSFWAQGRVQEAEVIYRYIVRILEAIYSGVPRGAENEQVYGQLLATGLTNQGELLQASAKLKEAEEVYRKAIAVYGPLIEVEPKLASWFCWETAELFNDLGSLLTEAGRFREAEAAYREALANADKVDGSLADLAEFSRSASYEGLGDALWAAERRDEARAAYRQSLAIRGDNAWLLATCADAGFRDPARAVAVAEKLRPESFAKQDRWKVSRTLGVARYRLADWQGAVETLGKSVEQHSWGSYVDRLFLGMAYWQMGNEEEGRRWYAEAVEWTEKNKPKDPQFHRFRTEAEDLMGDAVGETDSAEEAREVER